VACIAAIFSANSRTGTTAETPIYPVGPSDRTVSETLKLLQEVSSNSDNIDYREIIHAHNGREEGMTTFTGRRIEKA
jgi:hypothetical protein